MGSAFGERLDLVFVEVWNVRGDESEEKLNGVLGSPGVENITHAKHESSDRQNAAKDIHVAESPHDCIFDLVRNQE